MIEFEKRKNNYNDEITKELMDIFLSGMKKDRNNEEIEERLKNEEIEERLKNIFNKVLDNVIEEEKETKKDEVIINNRRFVRFKEISNKNKISDIWIDTSKIITVFDYNREVAIRIEASEFFIYKVEGTIEEVLDKIKDKK